MHELIASYVQAQEVVVKFSEVAWAFDSRRRLLITMHRAVRSTWQQMTSRLRLAGARNLSGPDHNVDFLRGLPIASLHWFLTEFHNLCELLFPLIPHESELATALRITRASCFPTLNPHVNAERLRALRDLWSISTLLACHVRRELRIMNCAMRGICVTIREGAFFHTSMFASKHGKNWWGLRFPLPTYFADSWMEVDSRAPFPASDMPIRTNTRIASDYLEFVRNVYDLPRFAKALHKHWQHHANWPAHGHMLTLHDY